MIITNKILDGRCLDSILTDLSDPADSIYIAVAFLSDHQKILNWIRKNKKVNLLVSLRPPTNYYALIDLFHESNINIYFLGNNFHSKMYIFSASDQPLSSVIGSSNFTGGGLRHNYETNVIFDDDLKLSEAKKQFDALIGISNLLEPPDLEAYKDVYDKYKKKQKNIDKAINRFQKNYIDKRKSDKKHKLGVAASSYYRYWRAVDEIRDLVGNISNKEYPGVPVYLPLDHFWHWVAVVWDPLGTKELSGDIGERRKEIPRMFKKYCKWEKSTQLYVHVMHKRSKDISKILSKQHILSLTSEDAKQIFCCTHAGNMKSRRFGADETFIMKNTLHEIATSLHHLLYSNNDVAVRINDLISNHKYKLAEFGSSGIQEIIGWAFPEQYPIRNEKANKAIKKLGYRI